jgi:DNA-binding NarL/FixJ family response regulator
MGTLGFEGVVAAPLEASANAQTNTQTNAEFALWDLCSYQFHYPLPPSVPTIAIVSEHQVALADLLRLGYRGFIRSHEGPDTLQRAFAALRRGEIWAERGVIMQALAPRESHNLTAQEHRVLGLVGQGLSNKDIASSLGVGEKTVKGYLSKLFEKLGAKNRTNLIVQHLKNRT